MNAEVHIKSDAPNTERVKVFLPDGHELRGIASIVISPLNPGDIITAKIELLSAIDIYAFATVTMTHPVSGEIDEVKRIEFANGSSWESGEISG